jgi:sugar/nucleoside kinase (ribokinase family)
MSFAAGLGNTNIDLLYQGLGRIPAKGEEVYAKDFSLELGGGVPATLINLGRLGIETRIATQLGGDMFSAFAREQYAKHGVEVANLCGGDGIPVTITSAIILDDDRSFISYGKGLEINGENEARFYELAKGCKVCLMQPDGFINVYKKLKSEGSILVLDSGWDDEMSFEKYRDYLELADYYTPNRKEAQKITGRNNPREAAYELKKYFDKVVVKLDSEGCIGIDGDDYFICPAVDEFKHIDSTGAGDAFLAGFVYGIMHGCSLKDCIEYGNITGGKAVTAVGALSAYLTEAELLAYKKQL